MVTPAPPGAHFSRIVSRQITYGKVITIVGAIAVVGCALIGAPRILCAQPLAINQGSTGNT